MSTMQGEERVAFRSCRTFDIYSMIDAQHWPTTDLSADDRIRAAVLAAAGNGLGTDVIVSLGPTVGRADVGDNDIVTTVSPDDLHPVFGQAGVSETCSRICMGRTVLDGCQPFLASRSRRTRCRILPVAVRGMSRSWMNSTERGRL